MFVALIAFTETATPIPTADCPPSSPLTADPSDVAEPLVLLADATLSAPPAVMLTPSSVTAVTVVFCTLTATAAAAETLPSDVLAERPLSLPASVEVAAR